MNSDEHNEKIGAAVKSLRLRRKLSREALAELTGFDKSQIWRIETAKVSTSVHSIAKICQVLDVPITAVLDTLDETGTTEDEFIKRYLSMPSEAKKKMHLFSEWVC